MVAGDNVLEALPDETDSVEAMVAQDGEIERMIVLLGRLPLQQRETVILRYVEGLSQAEIAEVLNVPVGTVKSRISLGLSRMRTLMQEVDEL
jgi:RNA polymerase sigma-70 factor (ECF subfamily)